MTDLANPLDSFLIVGLVFGMRHALESDHLAAIASLSDQSRGLKDAARIGIVWGLGHTLILLSVGAAMLVMNAAMSENMAAILGWFAGLMLILFGLDVLRRAYKTNMPLHSNTLNNDLRLETLSDAEAKEILEATHKQNQTQGHSTVKLQAEMFPHRAFIAGLIHGLAGSAALVLLTLSTVKSVWIGLGYILIFGLGSIIGMAMLSLVIALPLNKMKNMYAFYKLVCIVGGLFTVMVGVLLVSEHSGSLFASK